MINYSIIIPHKDNIELLKRCVASIPLRSDIQIIIVDDSSDSKNIPSTEQFNDSRVEIYLDYSNIRHASFHDVPLMSAGIIHPPWGLRLHLPVTGPSGIHERLNCCIKNRRMNVVSHFFMVSASCISLNACFAIKYIFSGENPLWMKW